MEAVEGQPYTLTCSSRGGSPAPDITWTRGLSEVPLRANTTRAADRDAATVSVLEITPRKEDDGVEFRCGVSSRATAATTQSHSLGASINISVNCEYKQELKNTLICYTTNTTINYFTCNRWYIILYKTNIGTNCLEEEFELETSSQSQSIRNYLM